MTKRDEITLLLIMYSSYTFAIKCINVLSLIIKKNVIKVNNRLYVGNIMIKIKC